MTVKPNSTLLCHSCHLGLRFAPSKFRRRLATCRSVSPLVIVNLTSTSHPRWTVDPSIMGCSFVCTNAVLLALNTAVRGYSCVIFLDVLCSIIGVSFLCDDKPTLLPNHPREILTPTMDPSTKAISLMKWSLSFRLLQSLDNKIDTSSSCFAC